MRGFANNELILGSFWLNLLVILILLKETLSLTVPLKQEKRDIFTELENKRPNIEKYHSNHSSTIKDSSFLSHLSSEFFDYVYLLQVNIDSQGPFNLAISSKLPGIFVRGSKCAKNCSAANSEYYDVHNEKFDCSASKSCKKATFANSSFASAFSKNFSGGFYSVNLKMNEEDNKGIAVYVADSYPQQKFLNIDGKLGLNLIGVSENSASGCLLNFLMKNRKITERKFSLYLAKDIATFDSDRSVLTFGFTNTSLAKGKFNYFDLVGTEGYDVKGEYIMIGREEIKIDSKGGIVRFSLSDGYLTVTEKMFEEIESTLIRNYETACSLVSAHLFCSFGKALKILPDFSVKIGENLLRISSENLVEQCQNVTKKGKTISHLCLVKIKKGKSVILGYPFLEDYIFEYDANLKRIGVALSKESKEDIVLTTEETVNYDWHLYLIISFFLASLVAFLILYYYYSKNFTYAPPEKKAGTNNIVEITATSFNFDYDVKTDDKFFGSQNETEQSFNKEPRE